MLFGRNIPKIGLMYRRRIVNILRLVGAKKNVKSILGLSPKEIGENHYFNKKRVVYNNTVKRVDKYNDLYEK